MVDLTTLFRPLVDPPLVPRPPTEHLRARARRRQHRRAAGLTGASVVVVVVCLAVAVLPGSTSPAPSPPSRSGSLASFIQGGVSVPDATLAAVGLPAQVTPPMSTGAPSVTTDGGKPAVVYVGAEFCPYCALQRWALLVALSRFGTFSQLGQSVSSSSTDVFPGLQSWSFLGSTYTSSAVTFDPAETYSSTPTVNGDGYEPLQSMDELQQGAVDTYDHGPALPFIDIGGRFVVVGASTSPQVLEGLSLDQIAADLDDPASPVAQAVDGTANYLIAAMCSVAPGAAAVCASPVVAQAQAAMAASPFRPENG